MTTNYFRLSLKANLLKLFFLAAFTLVMGVERSSASHGAGGNLTYTHLAGNQYLIHFTYYRDCFGIPAPTSVVVNIESNACGVTQQNFTAPEIGVGFEITYPCSTSQTTCTNGTAPGIQRHDYEVTIALPGQCPDWRIWVSDCCRNQAITTLNGAAGLGIYIEARLNNSTTDNNSPQFNIDPILFVCTGANFAFNNGAVDQDGDSLVYSFIAPRTDANTNCTYNPGYSAINPISSSPAVSIDPVTGDVSMFPTAIEVGVMVVLITEYRNGDLIGSVMRDIQIYTVACQNTAPSVGGINNTGNFQISGCAGSTICFDIPSSDPDAGDTLTMTYNGAGIPNATWTSAGIPFPTGHFCWTTTAADARTAPYTFFVTIRDNNCPSNGVQIYSFNITVGGGLVASLTSTPVLCNGDSNGTATATVTGGGTGPFTYAWSPNGDTTQTASNLQAGNYSVLITDQFGCQTTQSVTVTEPAALVTTITNLVDAGCGTLGSFDIVATGGTGNYSYVTNTIPPSNTSSVSAGAGTYLVTVTDDNNCQSTANVTVNGGGTIQATETHTNVSCHGGSNGTATVNVTGGNGNETYVWNPNVSSSNSASGLAAGTYTVDISDATCSTQVVIVISQPDAMAISSTSTPDSCSTGNGTASVTVSGGTGAYSYSWSPVGGNGSSASGLSAGTYVVTVTDGKQCTATETIVVAADNANCCNMTLTTSTTPESCSSANGTATVVVTGGVAPISYQWSPAGGTGATATGLASGIYTVVVTDGNGCSASATANVGSIGFSASITAQTDATCQGGDDGSATVTATGGTTPYTYSWSPVGGTGATAVGLSEGTYTVQVTDYLGCTVYVQVTIGFIHPLPAVSLGPDTSACIGSSIVLSPGANYSSYLWSDNSTASTLTVTTNGTYSVLVADAFGCQNTAEVNVSFVSCCCIPERCGHDNRKFIVCHIPPGNPNNPQTICVDSSAIWAHLTNHPGDCLGRCCSNAVEKNASENDMVDADLMVYPNPYNTEFSVHSHAKAGTVYTILIHDLTGRMVETYTGNADDAKLGRNLLSGVYTVEIISNLEVKTFKITKIY